MKIDFIGQKMAITFDKVPKFLYFNEDNQSCGAVLLDGQRVKALVSVDLHAMTNDQNVHPLSYKVNFLESREEKSIATGKTIKDCLTIPIKIMDLEPFKNALEVMKQYSADERIPEEIRKEFADKLFKSEV